MTMGDLIRSMTNAQMAVFFSLNVECDACMFKSKCGLPTKNVNCTECAKFVSE